MVLGERTVRYPAGGFEPEPAGDSGADRTG
nr:MAG TPA: hypothetical protein [Caudoviricetes sp.]